MRSSFARAAIIVLIPAAFAVACSSGDGVYTDKVDDDGNVLQKAQITETKTVMEGNIFNFPDGAKTVIIPADKAGTPKDLPCILFKDQTAGMDSSVGFGGASCDWEAAWGNRPVAGQPAPRAPMPMPK
jgi:hypothetical protein